MRNNVGHNGRGRRQALAISAWVGATLFGANALGGWPMSRHDPQRTGTAAGISNLTAPVPYWRAYLGGELPASGLLAADLDGDQKRELVYAAGGRVTATTADGSVLWQTKPVGVTALLTVANLDGAGGVELVAQTSNRVYVFDGATGKVAWAEPEGEMGTLAGVRVADLDGDGKSDLVIRECGCCGVAGTTSGVVYSFSTGATSPAQLWQFPPIGNCSDANSALVVANVDGVGASEIVTTFASTAAVRDGKTGTVLASATVPGDLAQYDACAPYDVDGAPGQEVVCVRSPPLAPSDGQRKAYVLRYDVASKELKVLWTKDLAPYSGGDLKAIEPLGDLDGDGTIELVVSTSSAQDVWTTRVLDAATGAEKATLPDRLVAGRITQGKSQLLLTTSSSSAFTAWAFDPATTPPLALKWTLIDVKGMTFRDPAKVLVAGALHWDRLVTADLDSDGLDDLVLRDVTSSGTSSRVSAWSMASGQPVKLGAFETASGVEAAAAWVVPPTGPASSLLAVQRNDGYLVLLDAKMQAANAQSATVPGIRTAGYFASGGWREHQRGPVMGSLGGNPAERIVAVDSRKALVTLDAAAASLASPPKVLWQKTHAYAPTIVAGLDNGKPGLACLAQQEPVAAIPQDLVVALRADGTPLWSKPLPRAPLNDIVPGTLDTDTVPDLLVQHGSPSDTLLRTRALSGATGATLWNSTPVDPGCARQVTGFAVSDWNGDGRSDVVFHGLATRVLSGTDGSELLQGGPGDCYSLPTLIDLDGDQSSEAVLHGSYSYAQAWSHDLKTKLWGTATDERPYPYGAVASCAGGLRLVEGSWQYPARLKLTTMSGSGAGTSVSLVLADGKAWAMESEAASGGAALGQLGSAAVHANLSGSGGPLSLVGSSTGWLYAVDPCTAKLAFSYEFDAPVGNIVFGDGDGDGLDELVVSVADGYLYGLKQPPVPAPTLVLDTDPDHGIDTADVDDIVTANKLSATWGSVTGATSYQVAVVRADLSQFVSAWKDVGLVTKHSVTGIDLVDGDAYVFAVRAIKDGAPSPDALSDGVTVHKATAEPSPDAASDAGLDASDAGTDGAPDASGKPSNGFAGGGGCDCRATPGAGSNAAAFAALGLAFWWGRRRGRRRKSA